MFMVRMLNERNTAASFQTYSSWFDLKKWRAQLYNIINVYIF